MIRLSNGHEFTFAVASGALGFAGDGYWWEQLFRWLGMLDPHQFTIITKTLTLYPRTGNLRWWCPWQSIKMIPGGTVNTVGLTNPGLDWWLDKYLPHVCRRGYKVIVSISPDTHIQAGVIATKLQRGLDKLARKSVVGVEINISCPNIPHRNTVNFIKDMTLTIKRNTDLPILVKLGCQDPYLEICQALDSKVDAFDLINSVPWFDVYPDKPSPLTKYGQEGGVSGEPIWFFAERVLEVVKAAGIKTPILSGGGVMSLHDIRQRFTLGADGVAFGSIFIKKPWLPNKLIRQWNC